LRHGDIFGTEKKDDSDGRCQVGLAAEAADLYALVVVIFWWMKGFCLFLEEGEVK
jgi:hypothetical protein